MEINIDGEMNISLEIAIWSSQKKITRSLPVPHQAVDEALIHQARDIETES